MIKSQREQRILDILAQAGEEVSVLEIAQRLGRVSGVTIRRDIVRLAEEGRVERTHGGAFLLTTSPQDAEAPTPRENALQDEIEGVDAIVLPPIGGRGADTLRMLAKRRRIPFLAESSPQEGGV
ncbi:MAG TPA: DeoR family transcriptional regulator, partial [Kaistia sp.]|nr:DeoR family transcriptional regulator [Kaistia sp.]